MKEIYLDNSATTKVIPQAVEAMAQACTLNYGNPSSLHGKGFQAEKLVKQVRETLAAILGCTQGEIYFTSGGTESNNWAIFGCAQRRRRRGNHILTTAIEHPSVLKAVQHLEIQGYEASYIGTDSSGVIDLEQIKACIRSDTILVSVMHVNNETGAIQPVKEIGHYLKQSHPETVFHVDGIQSLGKVPLNPGNAGVDLMSFSAHKIHGPKGVGALFIRKGLFVEPLMLGGEQENKMRPGTENVPGIAGFGAAAAFIPEWLKDNSRIVELKEKLICSLRQRVQKVQVNGSAENGVPHVVNFSFPGIKAEVLVHHLEQSGIYVSTGSACHSRSGQRSHVLEALGLNGENLEGAVRISFSHLNTSEEIDTAAEKIAVAVLDLQSLR